MIFQFTGRRLQKIMEVEAKALGIASNDAVEVVTRQVKNDARQHVASRLGRRAGFLITSRIYQGRSGQSAGFIYSRWQRKITAGGSEFASAGQQSGASGSGGFADIMGRFETGGIITPRRSKFLYIPLVRGRLRRRERRAFQGLDSGAKITLIPLAQKNSSGRRYLVIDRGLRGRGNRPIAILQERVRIKKKLDLFAIFDTADDRLRAELVARLEAQASRLAA